MIRKIIKLNGDVVDFEAAKVNGWGIWASENLGDRVDWSSIVMDAVSGKPETVSSQDLQGWLIEECLNRKTWSHYLMAGRLYAILLRKQIYKTNGTPTVHALHQRMIKDKIMVDLKYSLEDYETIESFIDHSLDLTYPHFSLQYIREKYALKNRNSKEEYETPQFTYMRMAMALSANEPRDVRLEHVKNFYMLFSNKILSAPTPNYVNLGTVHNGLASCCLFASADNGTSLAMGDYIANIMTQNSAGIGVNIMSRSLGDPIRDGLIIHQGKKPYVDSLAKAIKANLQNGRGGAGTLFYNSFDPESSLLSQLRNPRSVEALRNRDLHYAMLANSLFLAKAARGEKIFTWNAFTAPDLHKAFYGPDVKEFIEIYNRYEADESFVKNYVDARELLKINLNEAYETGTAYIAFIDEINRNTPFKEPIHSSNLCVVPSTKVLTDAGHITIGQYEGRKVNVWNGVEFSETTIVKTSDASEIMSVNLSNGYFLNSTTQHHWYVKNSNGEVVRKETRHLIVGEELHDFELPVITGGNRTPNPRYTPTVQNSIANRLKWIAELAAKQGVWLVSKTASKLTVRLEIKTSVGLPEALEISNVLATLGVKTRFDSIDTLTVQHKGVMQLRSLGLDVDSQDFKYSEFEDDESIKVARVSTRKGTSATYCFTEPKRNMGTFNNILTGQCLEIAEPTVPYENMMDLYSTEDHGRGEIAMCSLAAIVVDVIETMEDPEAMYELASYYALKMIDYCIENNKYPFPHLELTAKARKSAGIGIMGFATHLARKGLKYSSQAGKRETHRIAERHFYHAARASLRISKETGLATWMHKTKWPEGWLPTDNAKTAVESIVEGGFVNVYDHEQLRKDIIANGGLAHSVLIAYMPGESSSKAVGGTNSIYPARRPTMLKTDNAVVVRWAAPNHDDPSYEYEYAYDVPTKDMIDTYAIFQKFTDQAISADLYRRIVGADKITSNEMLKDCFYMAKMGMKTRYYQNTETNAGIDLDNMESGIENNEGDVGCAGGFCTL